MRGRGKKKYMGRRKNGGKEKGEVEVLKQWRKRKEEV
jgi:hypothetical protein